MSEHGPLGESVAPFTVAPDGTLRFRNGVECGSVIREVDGYYVWYPRKKSGFWESHYLHAIAYLLEGMNEEWDRVVKSDPRLNPPGAQVDRSDTERHTWPCAGWDSCPNPEHQHGSLTS